MPEDYYSQYCREHTDAEARAWLIDQCRKGDKAVAILETRAAQLEAACELKDEALQRIASHARSGPADDEEDTCERCEILAEDALHLTPEAVKRHAEYARIGRAVEEWARDRRAPEDLSNIRRIGYAIALDNLRVVIARAKGGGKDA